MTESEGVDAAVGSDPDAPWRRGYDGPEPQPLVVPRAEPEVEAPSDPAEVEADPWSRPPEPVVEDPADGAQPPPAEAVDEPSVIAAEIGRAPTAGWVVLVGVAVVAGIVVAVVAAVALVRRGDDAVTARIPASIEERWSLDVDRLRDLFALDDVVVIVEAEGVRALDAVTGAERWSVASAQDGVTLEGQPVGDIVVINERFPESLVVRGVEASTGEIRWSRKLVESRNVFVLRGAIFEFEFGPGPRERVVLLDRETGLPITERLGFLDVAIPPPVIAVRAEDGSVAIVEVDTGETVGSLDSTDGIALLTRVGDRLVTLGEDGTLALRDDAGVPVDEIDAGLGGERTLGLFPRASDDLLIVVGPETTLGVGVDAGGFDVRWSLNGLLIADDEAGDGGFAVLDPARASDPARLVDLTTGETIVRFDDEVDEFFVLGAPRFASNGLVLRAAGRLIAFDLAGTELWTIDGDIGSLAIGDGYLAVVDGDQLTAYG